MKKNLVEWAKQNKKENILQEWDYQKNDRDPITYAYGSNDAVWWVCPMSHSYLRRITERTSQNCGCPFCSGRKLLSGFNDLKTWCEQNNHEDILALWNSMNKISPVEIRYNSTQKVCWKCIELGHEWVESINNITINKRRCPYCSNRKVLAGYNDFATWCNTNEKEYLLQEWDYEKNNIQPTEVTHGSEKIVWWICPEGHSYEKNITSRASNGVKCPYCTCNRLLVGYNDFATRHRELLKYWNYEKNQLQPTEILWNTTKKIWWKCSLGHEWNSKISDKVKLICECPFCSGSKTLSGFNDLKTWCIDNGRNDLLSEWDYERNSIDITDISPSNSKKVWWKCSLGHEWNATIGSRTNIKKPCGCPYCSIPPKKILVGFNDFETWCLKNNREMVLSEWDYEKNEKEPKDYFHGSGKSVWWKCNKGHSWNVAIVGRKVNNCPICTRTQTSFPEQTVAFYASKYFDINQRKKIAGYEVDVFLIREKIAIEYDGLYYHENELAGERERKKNLAIEREGIKLFRIKEDRKRNGIEDNIIYFHPRRTYISQDFENALRGLFLLISRHIGEDINPNINLKKDEYDIRKYYMSSLLDVSLEKMYPAIAKEWDKEKNGGLTPDLFAAKSHDKMWWKCKNGHSWEAAISSRTGRELGCPYCAGQMVWTGENDLETWCKKNEKFQLLEEWDYSKNDVMPNEIAKTSGRLIWWKCKNGHEWKTTLRNRFHGTACPICNNGNNAGNKGLSLEKWCINNNYEHLLDEWDYENNIRTPIDVTYGSHLKVWWKCKNGHKWQAVIKSRTHNHGCPYCSSSYKLAVAGVNDLCTWCSENSKEYIIEEWNYDKNDVLPQEVTRGSHKKIWWKCKNGHEWQAEIKSRTSSQHNTCPICKEN